MNSAEYLTTYLGIASLGQVHIGGVHFHMVMVGSVYQRKLVGGAIGGWAHYNGWNGINGTVPNTSNTWKQRV